MLKKIFWGCGILILVVAAVLVGQYYGRRSTTRPTEWLSQDLGRMPVDFEITCPSKDAKHPGKSLGRIQADMNLTNGKWRVVRNDPGKWPYCD